MTDYFALLNEARRPWIEESVLRQKFVNRSTDLHPDRVHHLGPEDRASAQERYVELNAAYNSLREPRDRLRHLLELELGALPKEIQQIPSDLMDLFLRIGQFCREADALLIEKEKVTSPLLKVQFFERSQVTAEKLQDLQKTVRDRRDLLIERLKQTDAEWTAGNLDSAGRVKLLSHLEELYRLFSYFDRWLGQIQERIVRLAF